MSTVPAAEVLRALRRHQVRRERDVPTLSTLVGPSGRARAAWSAWCKEEGRGEVAASSMATPALSWLNQLPRQTVLTVLAGRAPLPVTAYERTAWLEGLGETPGVARLLGLLSGPSPLQDFLSEAEALPLVGSLTRLLPVADTPTLLVEAPVTGGARACLGTLGRLCFEAPRLPVALVLSSEASRTLLACPESRALALLREGLLPLEATTPAVSEEVAARCAESLSRLVRESAPPEVLQAFVEAATCPKDRARSAAEALLFRLLESRAETRGLFQLNGTLPWRFGPRSVEVDLLCTSLSLALEVDGWHHFQGAEAWRRDRRKDVALQQHGFLVLRVRAEDVVLRLGQTLDAVLGAVAHQRASARS